MWRMLGMFAGRLNAEVSHFRHTRSCQIPAAQTQPKFLIMTSPSDRLAVFFYAWLCMMSSRMDICMFTRSDRGWTDWLNDQDGIKKDYVELWIMQSCSRRVQEENTEVEMSNFKMRVNVQSVGLKSVPSFCLIPPVPSCIYFRCLCLQIATWATKWSLFKSNPTELYASLFNKRENLISQRVS